jgi:hypothetical protein
MLSNLQRPQGNETHPICVSAYALTITAGDWWLSVHVIRSDIEPDLPRPPLCLQRQSPCVMVLAFNIASADVIMLGIAKPT